MIPVKLTIQGLYSYQEKQTIDFSKLTGAGLFGIFGAVGSGKSSILEAITFALYGKTDRLNLSGDNRNYNMMNLKSSELLIDFEFETGKEQTAYRAIVKGKRNSKRFDDVKTLERSALRFEDKTWSPVEPELLEKAIGLSYDNFKRTIIIPQGQFQEFLQLGNKDRTQMMKELFGLEKFELYGKTVALENANNEKIQNLQGQLQQLGAIEPGEIDVLSEKLKEQQKEIVKLNTEINEKQQQETGLKKLKELFIKKEEATEKLAKLNEQLPVFEHLEKTVAAFEYCLFHFRPIFDNINVSARKIMLLEKKTGEESISLKQVEEQISFVEAQFGKIKPAYENREKLRQQTEELNKLLRLSELEQLIELAESRIKKGDEIIQKTTQNIDSLKQEKESLEIRLKTEKETQPDMKVLSDARSWHEVQSGILQQLTTNSTDLEKVNIGIIETQKETLILFDNEYFSGFTGEKNIETAKLFLKHKNSLLKKEMAEIENEIQHFRVQQKLGEFSFSLKEGEACPVCGSMHHPLPLIAADVAGNLKIVESRKQMLEKEISRGEQITLKLSELSNLLFLSEKQLSDIQERRTAIEKSKNEHESLFQWGNYPTMEAVNAAFLQEGLLRKTIEQLEKQKSDTIENYERETQNREKYQREIEKIKNETGSYKTEKQVLSSQIHLIDSEKYFIKTKIEIEEEKNFLLKQYAELEKQFNQLNEKLLELRRKKDNLNGSIAANQLQLANEKQILKEYSQKLEIELVASEFKTTDDVQQILELELNISEEKQKIALFRQELMLLKDTKEQLSKEIGERNYDAEFHRQLLEILEKNRSAFDLLNRELGITQKSLADLQKALETLAQLKKTFEHLQLRAENIKTMKSLFKASGFVNYISSVYLQNLCNAANDRFFKLTRQKLSLEITEDNNFQVRDFMNGGKVRSVKTLSGGQTFQAALSLALALADNIQKITESNQNFFFLDEGFGSLDKESLSVVFDTLKSLRHENRIVGVISHVEEMQQEIEVHLRVVNNEDTGSRIIESWIE